ncbi:MAG TPA: energy transducer TonB, partial [Minicystis sp.]|nr:energy transducer TonB [Minicystis sp.]
MTQQNVGSNQPNRPGQMTAVMRAMPQVTGPKVLRIGLVQGGKVIEERVIKQRSHVTIGPSEKSMFVIPSKSLPANFRLFELIGGEYCLNFLDGMTGRVALKTGISDLQALRAQAKRVPLGSVQAYQVQLSDEARGKVVVGETTFLFQFVAPPPVQPKPQLPVSVKAGLASEIDWTTTIIAAFSFLFHFGAVGSIYSDWMDPV